MSKISTFWKVETRFYACMVTSLTPLCKETIQKYTTSFRTKTMLEELMNSDPRPSLFSLLYLRRQAQHLRNINRDISHTNTSSHREKELPVQNFFS